MSDIVSTFEEFLEHNKENKIIDYKNPKCVNCNDCCSLGTVLTKKEYHRIKKYLTTDPNGVALYKRGKAIIKEFRNKGMIYFKCPLSSEISKKCGIYKIRPQICRDFHCSPHLNKVKERPDYDPETFTIADLFFDKNVL